MDLIQVGSMGLLKSIDGFDTNSGYKFSTYAYHWILQRVSKEYFDKKNLIRIPVYLLEIIPKIEAAKSQLISTGKKPTVENIAEFLGEPVSKIKLANKYQGKTMTGSLDFEYDNGVNLVDVVEQDTFLEPEKTVELKEFEIGRSEAIEEALRTFSPRNRSVIIYRYGLDGFGRKRTLGEVSELVGVTKERVRQIERTTLDLLREGGGFSNRRKKLKKYSEGI